MSERADSESNDNERWQQRTLHSEAGFVIPHLRSGMRLVDVGCGPGSVTLGLAQVVAPGRVIGVDMSEARLDIARRSAAKRQQDNVNFVVGDAGSLPFNTESVDVVFANGLIEHLGNPARALDEFRRVLVSGGIVALRSPDWGSAIVAPRDPRLDRSIDLRNRWQRHHGGDPEAGRTLAPRAAGNSSRMHPARVSAFGRCHRRRSFEEKCLVSPRRNFGPRQPQVVA